MMKIPVELGGIRFCFDSDRDIKVEGSCVPFFYREEAGWDVRVRVSHRFSEAPKPRGPMIGEDLLTEYYREDGLLYCLTKGGEGRTLACCTWDETSPCMTCWVSFPEGSAADSLGNLLRMIPLRRILLQHGVLFLHAAQIAVGGKGILFSAPSQTGKTTQARLWQRCRGARVLCNDRTLTDGTRTFGFPMDGSEPVCCGESCTLGAITVLEQAPENTVRRLRPREAVLRLMPQMVLDTWDPEASARALQLLLTLMERVPVYLLRCTPDADAVVCLERQLFKDGVITDE